LDEKICINFFSTPKKRNSNLTPQKSCAHLGSLVYDGYNGLERNLNHRVKCSACGKRFGNDVESWDLLAYQQKIKKILYELFVLNYPLTGVAKRWGITQQKLSLFKKSVVSQIFKQNSEIIEQKLKALPGGIMLADETFMGPKGNSHVEIVFINEDFESLSTGYVGEEDLKESILKTFEKIPEACRNKLKVLITDGEPSYKEIVRKYGRNIVHIAQLHNHDQRGDIIVSKYEKLGPHFLHYKITTHWKAFYQDKHLLTFNWEIKFIKGKIQATRGRPRKSDPIQNNRVQWRQKLENYRSESFEKEGTATLFVNFETNKLSMRAGCKNWMIRALTPVFKIFKEKHVTTNMIESKHSQIKRNGAKRKQRDKDYGHKLFTLHAFLVEFGCIPFTNLTGRPLYKFLMDNNKKEKMAYRIVEPTRTSIQTVLNAY